MRIGTLFGIPFYLDSSWFIILVLVTIFNADSFNQTGIVGLLTGFILAIFLFSSVLLHELGHSLVAQAQGIKVNSITLFLFGGVASLEKESATPFQAVQVAIAGPLVSFCLCGIFWLLTKLFTLDHTFGSICLEVARVNLVLGIFNLIPGLPLDGGQVLKAIIWQVTKDRFQGMQYAGVSGKVLGWFGIITASGLVFLTGDLGVFWLGLIGWFILRNATVYEQVAILQKTIFTLTAQDVMTRKLKVLNGHLTIRDFSTEYILNDQPAPMALFVASEGRYRGLLRIKDLQNIARDEWESTTLNQIVHPLNTIPTVKENTPLYQVILKLEAQSEPWLTVLSPADTVSGTIDRAEIVKAVAQKQNLFIPELEMQRVKNNHVYPQGLQLAVIAKMLENLDQ